MTLSTRRFGRTGRTPTAIGFGAWAIGGSWGDVSEADACRHAEHQRLRESGKRYSAGSEAARTSRVRSDSRSF